MFTVRQGTNELVELIDGNRLATIGKFYSEVFGITGITSAADDWKN